MPFVVLLKYKMNSILIIMIMNNGNTKHGKTSLEWERYQQPRYHRLVSMAGWWRNFLRRFLTKWYEVWFWYFLNLIEYLKSFKFMDIFVTSNLSFILIPVRQYDNTALCGLVWTADFVAFRCRTCGISQCMSLCNECFKVRFN